MKYLMFAALCIVTCLVKAQSSAKYLIIDRKLKQPAQYAEAISDEQMNKGFFAVEAKNVNSLVGKLDSLRNRLRSIARENYDQTRIEIGTTLLSIKVTKLSVADRLNIALSTDTGNGHNREFNIVDGRLTNNHNAKYLNKLIAYINKSK